MTKYVLFKDKSVLLQSCRHVPIDFSDKHLQTRMQAWTRVVRHYPVCLL